MNAVRGSDAAAVNKLPPRPRNRGPQRAAAVVLSLVIHGLIFLFAFASASGDLISRGGAEGGPNGPVFAVTLVRPTVAGAAGQESAPALLPLFMKLRATPAESPLALPTGDRADGFAAMADRLRGQQPKSTQLQASEMASKADEQGSPHPSPLPASRAQLLADAKSGDDGDRAGSTSTGSLWGIVEPCWRNLGPRGRVPVVLEVSLDGAADLRVPPRVIRSPSALIDEPRLQAESSALAALAACIPRGDLRFGRKTYRLEFPAAPSP